MIEKLEMTNEPPRFARRYKRGGKDLGEGAAVWAVFNYVKPGNGNLVAQQFCDVWERESSHSDRWRTIEAAADKIAAFTTQPWVENLMVIGEASDAHEALALAKERGMAPIQKTVVYREKIEED